MITLKRIVLFSAFCSLALVSVRGDDRTYGDVVVARVVDVYDGDTFRCDIEGWPAIIGDSISVRIRGVDTPEIRGTSGYVKKRAELARKYTANRLRRAKKVTLRNIARGKYFRIVADVYVDKDNLCRELIRVGLGKEYDGGTRPSW
jgi:endonuclease YncB( thermonuclease family)